MASRQQEADPQLAKLLQLAQVSEAFNKPQQDDAVLAQQDQQHRMALAVQLLGLAQQGQHESAQSQDAANQLAELAKFHEGTLGHEQAALDQQKQERQDIISAQTARDKAETARTIFSEVSRMPGTSLATLGGIAHQQGYPEIANTLAKQDDDRRTQAVAMHLAGYAAQPPGKRAGYLKTIQSDPSMDSKTWQMLQQHLPQTELPPNSSSPSPTPEPASNPQRGERQPNNLDLSGLFRLLGKLPTSI